MAKRTENLVSHSRRTPAHVLLVLIAVGWVLLTGLVGAKAVGADDDWCHSGITPERIGALVDQDFDLWAGHSCTFEYSNGRVEVVKGDRPLLWVGLILIGPIGAFLIGKSRGRERAALDVPLM